MPDMRSYRGWLAGNTESFFNRGEAGGSEINARCVNELNFHNLNQSLLPMWSVLAQGGWQSDQQRRAYIGGMRKELAVGGLVRYVIRKKFVGVVGSEMLFTDRNRPFAEATNGALQEFDTGVVLLDVVQKHPNLLLLPSPLQFECGPDSRRNVDFLVVDMAGKRAVGAQVKSNVRDETVARYDPDRVVLIDGNIDFDNVLSMRTQKGSSRERVVGWPGMLAAKRTLDLPIPGKGMSGPERLENYRIREMARTALGPIKVDYHRAVARMDGRIMEKL
jgi:hypothetical protein